MDIKSIREMAKKLQVGQKEKVTFSAYINESEAKDKKDDKGNGDPRRNLFLNVQDPSGDIRVVFWNYSTENPEHCKLKAGSFVRVDGEVDLYNGAPNVTMRSFSILKGEKPEDYIRFADIDIVKEEESLRKIVKKMKDPDTKKLMLHFLDNPNYMKLYWRFPAAKKMHDTLPRGLANHVRKVIHIAQAIAPFYPSANIDWIVTAAFFHDMGKFREFKINYVGRCEDYTPEGSMIGHHEIACEILMEAAKELDIPDHKMMYLKHMILSHHGKGEWGSAQKPMTIDAMILHLADYVDAKCEPMEVLSTDMKPGERSQEKFMAIDGSWGYMYLPTYNK